MFHNDSGRFSLQKGVFSVCFARMPRGKRTVFTVSCSACGTRIGSVRLLKQNSKGVTWKDYKPEKYCGTCRKHVAVKVKEERHTT